MNRLEEIIRIESEELANYIKKASVSGSGTPQEVADRREADVRNFFERYFPKPHKTAKGKIDDTYGNRSASVDCLVLNPCHPLLTDANGLMTVILADGVDYAIEIKSNLGDRQELEKALGQSATVKSLRRRNTSFIASKARLEPAECYFQIPSIILCENWGSEVNGLLSNVVSYYEQKQMSRAHQFDILASRQQGIVVNIAPDHYFVSGDIDYSLTYAELGLETMGALLAMMMRMPRCEPTINEPVLSHYLKPSYKNWSNFPELDRRLANLNHHEQSN